MDDETVFLAPVDVVLNTVLDAEYEDIEVEQSVVDERCYKSKKGRAVLRMRSRL